MKPRLKKGFTLIELMVVVSIIGLLSSIVLAGFSLAEQKARDSVRLQDMDQVRTAMNMYALDHDGQFPAPAGESGQWFDCLGVGDGKRCVYTPNNVGYTEVDNLLKPYISTIPLGPLVPGEYAYSYFGGYHYLFWFMEQHPLSFGSPNVYNSPICLGGKLGFWDAGLSGSQYPRNNFCEVPLDGNPYP